MIAGEKKEWTRWPTFACGAPQDAVRRDWLFRVFVSHVWEEEWHPDPNGSQFEAVCELSREFAKQMTGSVRMHLYGEDLAADEAASILPGFRSLSARIGSMLSGDHIKFFNSTGSLELHRQYVAENTGLWYDYELVPQKPHVKCCKECRRRQQEAIGSIMALTRMSGVVLVAESRQQALERGWVLSETTTANASNNIWFWNQSQKRLEELDWFGYASRLMDPKACMFTNGSDGQKLRILNFAMLLLEPNGYYGHVQHMLHLVGIDDVSMQGLPSADVWRIAVTSDDLRFIRYENPEFCERIQDPRFRLRKIVNMLVQCSFERPERHADTIEHDDGQFVSTQLRCAKEAAMEVIDDELAAGLNCFPWNKERVNMAIEKRRSLVFLCLENVARLLTNDGDARADYFLATKTVVEIARLLDQYRIYGGELRRIATISFMSAAWVKYANVENSPDFIHGVGLRDFSEHD